jgi:hypothetical protein
VVNPERQHNALAALDILARADATAFAHGRSDAVRDDSSDSVTVGRLTPHAPADGS